MRHSIHLAASRVVVGAALALAAVGLGACQSASSSRPASVPHGFYGIVENGSLNRADFARMARAGVGSLRFQIYWAAVQGSRDGDLDWSSTDQTVARAARRRIDLLPIVVGTPAFVAPDCPACGATIQVSTRAQRRDWQRFLRAAVRRYGPGGSFWRAHSGLPPDPIGRWQIWNEQNNPVYNDPPGVYARFLGLSKRAIDSVDPHGKLVLGGMFGTPKGSLQGGVTAWSYLRLLFEHGAGHDFDAVALHPYSPNLAGIRYQIEKIRAVLRAHGASRIPIIITEIGWGSGGKGNRHPGTGSRGQVFVVDAKQQAANLTNSFNLLTSHRHSWRIGGAYWFTWKDPTDPPPGLCAFCYSSGLYRANGRTAKPALSAYESFTRMTRGTH